jgi:glycerol-3-phosphate dehydrogenase
MDEVECAVIGAGIAGLAIARSLALSGREVLVVEREGTIGSHTSARNSEVIHAGIYYPQDSVMARFCVEGRKALYVYCGARVFPSAAAASSSIDSRSNFRFDPKPEFQLPNASAGMWSGATALPRSSKRSRR